MKKKRLITAGVALTALLMSATPVSAWNAFDSYTYDLSKETVASPDAVETDVIVTGADLGIESFNNPSDIYVTDEGIIYIADSGNNRIVVLSKELSVLRVIDAVTDGKEICTFSSPQGIFVHSTGVYVADTGNKRLVVFDQEQRLLRVIGAPDSDSLPSTFDYKPTKVLVDSVGRIFVTSAGFNMGIIEMDKSGEFVGCLGANKVNVTAWEYFWRLISTEAQIKRSASFVPIEYNNINIDEDGFIYATTNSFTLSEYAAGTATPLRKLNAKGDDILMKNGIVEPYGDTEIMSTGSYRGASSLVDVCTLEYGMYAILDANRCRVFVYSAEGDLLFEFGSPGLVKGTLQIPCALEYADGMFYVIDTGKRSLTRYTLNDYGKKLYTAAEYHYKSQYDEETDLWVEIAAQNINNANALTGLGKAAYRNKDFETAMQYFRTAEDKTNYSKAYKMHRMEVIKTTFPYAMGGVFVLILLGTFFRMCRKRRMARERRKDGIRAEIRYAFHVIFHPFDGFWDLKREKRGSLRAALWIIAAACVCMAVYERFTGFIFLSARADEVNIFLSMLKVVAPLLLFCICNWCVTSLMEGEGRITDIAVASGYALTPMVLLLPPATLLSNVLVLEERDFYSFLVTVAFAWMFGLLVCGNQQTHDYSMGKTLVVLGITAIVMMIVIFLCILIVALVQQIGGFARDFYNELIMRL